MGVMEHRTSSHIGNTPYRAHGWYSSPDGSRFAITCLGRCRFLFELFSAPLSGSALHPACELFVPPNLGDTR
jgi:hypothetical protein